MSAYTISRCTSTHVKQPAAASKYVSSSRYPWLRTLPLQRPTSHVSKVTPVRRSLVPWPIAARNGPSFYRGRQGVDWVLTQRRESTRGADWVLTQDRQPIRVGQS